MSSQQLVLSLSSQQLELLKQYARLLLTIDGLWFLGVERSAGQDAAVRMDEEVWRRFGAIEARRLLRLVGREEVQDAAAVGEIVSLSPIWISLDHEVQIVDGRCLLSVRACHPQLMRVEKGLGEFPCKSVGTAYLEGFTPVLSPALRFRCVVCPPDEHPEDLWCRWELWLE